MKKIFLSICLLFSVVIAAVAEDFVHQYDQYEKMTLMEYYNADYLSFIPPYRILFEGYIVGIDATNRTISFSDDTALGACTYNGLTTDIMKTILKWQRKKTRLQFYVTKEITENFKSYFFLICIGPV